MDYRYTRLLLTGVDDALKRTFNNLNSKLDNLRIFFSEEHEQVITVIGLIYQYKNAYPLGLHIHDFIKLLSINRDKFGLFQSNSYVYCMINRLVQTGLLELRHDGTFEVSILGAEYHMRSMKT